MTISDLNPAILLFLALVAAIGLGHLVGLIRRASSGRYDIRDEGELRERGRR